MRDYQLVSSDSHLEVPPTDWTDRLPKHLREKGPRVVRMPDGGDGWALGSEEKGRPIAGPLTAGLKYREFKNGGMRWEDRPLGTGGPEQRLSEMDADSVDAEVLYCSIIAEAAKKADDGELAYACVRAYNDWLSDYVSYAPGRLIGLPLMPTTGINDALAELERVAPNPRFHAIQLVRFPSGGGWLTDDDERFWALAEEKGLVIAAHHNFGHAESDRYTRPTFNGDSQRNGLLWLLTCDMMTPTIPIDTILQLMLGGVLDRHPTLRFTFAETHIGWIPFWLEHMEDRYDRHRFRTNVDLARRPTEYVRDQFNFTFMEDHIGVKLRHEIGIDNISWASDFPHPAAEWPWSQEVAARLGRGIPNEDRRKIQALNIIEWLRIITPAEKERLAKEPVVDKGPAELTARGARRLV